MSATGTRAGARLNALDPVTPNVSRNRTFADVRFRLRIHPTLAYAGIMAA